MSLRHDLVSISNDLFNAIGTGNSLSSLALCWGDLAGRVVDAHQRGLLRTLDVQIAAAVASNVNLVATSIIDIRQRDEEALDEMSIRFERIFLDNTSSPSPPPKPLIRAKRACRPSLRPRRPSTPPPPQISLGTSHDPRSLPLRHWFLTHLSFPYPSPDEKLSIASDCGITRAKVDSDMTNWRRRSGWTDMMVRFGGDRELMKNLIERMMGRIERGEENKGEDKGVEDAVDGVRRYLMGLGPKVEMGWLDDLSNSNGIKPSTIPRLSSSIPNSRKRRQSSLSPDISDSEEEEQEELTQSNLPLPPLHRSMPHIPSISSLSTTSTAFHSYPYSKTGVRTVSGSSYATDSTFADNVDSESGYKLPQDTFNFTPMYSSAYGLNPSMGPQISKKRPAETVLESENGKMKRGDTEGYYHPGPGPSSIPYHQQQSSSNQPPHPTRSSSNHSSHNSDSSHNSVSGTSSPSSVTDVEINYIPIPYPSFSSSGQILQGHSSGSGSGLGEREGGEGEQGYQGQGIWSTTAPLATLDPSFFGSGNTMTGLPQEFAFAPRFGARV